MATIPLTITGIREAQQQLEDLGKEFDKFKKDPIKSKKLAKEFNDLSKDIDKATESFEEMNRSGQHLSATFEQIYGEDLKPMTGRIGELEDRLYELALAGAENTEEFAQMSQEVVRLKTTIRETDKQIDLMTENRGLAVFGEGFTQIGASLLRLDFQTAAKDATALNSAVGNLSKMGTQALTGLGKTVGQLSKAFVKMGVALLANPIFLIAAVIAGVIAIVVALADKLNFLQPILEAINYIFEEIKKSIDALIQGLKDYLDWIGLTSFAHEEAVNKQVENLQKLRAEQEKQLGEATAGLEHEIALRQASGEDTYELELEKQRLIADTAQQQQDALLEEGQLLADNKKLTKEKAEELQKQLDERKQKTKDALNAIEILEAQHDKKLKDLADQEAKEAEARRKEQLAKYKQYLNDRLNASRRIKDLELELEQDGIQKELAINAEKYRRLIEDVQKNEKLTSEEKIRLKELLAEQEFNAEKDIRLKYQEELDKALKDADEKRREEEEKARQAKLEADKMALEEGARIAREQLDKQLAEQEAYNTARLELGGKLAEGLSGIEQLIASTGRETAGLQKTIALVQIATDTAKAISAVVAGATAAAAAGGPAAPFLIAGYIASGIGTVASAIAGAYTALQKAPSLGGSVSGGSPVGGGVGATSTQPATPSFELFGQNNNANNLTSAPDNEQGQEITVKAVVSETEVTDTQNKIKKIQDLASL